MLYIILSAAIFRLQ